MWLNFWILWFLNSFVIVFLKLGYSLLLEARDQELTLRCLSWEIWRHRADVQDPSHFETHTWEYKHIEKNLKNFFSSCPQLCGYFQNLMSIYCLYGGGYQFWNQFLSLFWNHQCCDLWITPKFSKLVFQLVKLKLGGGKAVNEFISSNLKIVLFYGWWTEDMLP